MRRVSTVLVVFSLILGWWQVPPAAAVSNSGVEFWAVQLDNLGWGSNFVIAVSNPSDQTATVEVFDVDGVVETASIPSGELYTFNIPHSPIDGTTQTTQGVYRVASDQEVVAYQFNPFENVFTNDASLLLPTVTLGSEYLVMARQTTSLYGSPLTGSAAVVATQPGETQVTITVTGQTTPGSDIPALQAGETTTRTLHQFEVLQVQSAIGSDLTGSRIQTDQPVAAFGGSDCSFIPDAYWACDHLEEQLFPTVTWGSNYATCRMQQRSTEPELLRIIALEDDTNLTYDPPVAGAPSSLNAGQWAELEIDGDVAVEANKPISLGQYLVGSDYGAGIGDPALVLTVPREQFRSTYQFLTPDTYAYDFLTITAPTGASVTVDGETVPAEAFIPIGETGYGCARIEVGDGVHDVSSDMKVGIAIHGYDYYASYAYPGGLELRDINCEDGLRALDGTPLEGALSETIHDTAEPPIDDIDPALGETVHRVNCDVIAGTEDRLGL